MLKFMFYYKSCLCGIQLTKSVHIEENGSNWLAVEEEEIGKRGEFACVHVCPRV